MRHLLVGMFALIFAAAGLVGAEPKESPKESTVGGKTRDEWLREIKDRDPGVAAKAMQAVALFGHEIQKEAAPLLVSRLNDQDVSVKVNAALAIGEVGLGTKDVAAGVAALRRLLGDKQAVVRFHAAVALGRLKTDAKLAIPDLLYTIQDTTCWEIRKAAAFALGNTGVEQGQPPDPRVVRALVRTLGDTSSKVRLEAVLSLIVVGPPPALIDRQAVVSALQNLLTDRDKIVTIWARLGLMRMDKVSEPHLAAIAKLMLTSPEMAVRANAAQALGQVGSDAKAHIPELIKALEEREMDVVSAAASALAQMKDAITPTQLASLTKLLEDSDVQVRCQAAHTLGLLGDKARMSIPELVAMLGDKEPTAVVTAATALGDMGGVASAALPALNKLADHPNEAVRLTAAEAVRRIGRK